MAYFISFTSFGDAAFLQSQKAIRLFLKDSDEAFPDCSITLQPSRSLPASHPSHPRPRTVYKTKDRMFWASPIERSFRRFETPSKETNRVTACKSSESLQTQDNLRNLEEDWASSIEMSFKRYSTFKVVNTYGQPLRNIKRFNCSDTLFRIILRLIPSMPASKLWQERSPKKTTYLNIHVIFN